MPRHTRDSLEPEQPAHAAALDAHAQRWPAPKYDRQDTDTTDARAAAAPPHRLRRPPRAPAGLGLLRRAVRATRVNLYFVHRTTSY
jgi:hypothetical protein